MGDPQQQTPPAEGHPHVVEGEDDPQTILLEAQAIVYGRGEANYDHPLDNFGRIAAGWSVILGVEVTPEQVGLCNIWTKITREVHKPQRDNRVDMAGYAETVDRVITERERRGSEPKFEIPDLKEVTNDGFAQALFTEFGSVLEGEHLPPEEWDRRAVRVLNRAVRYPRG